MKSRFGLTAPILVVCGLASLAAAREDYGFRLGTPAEGGFVYRPTGVPIYTNTLDPTVHRWYMPQIFFQEYGRRQWEWTNYARKRYHRYGSPAQDGNDFYDFYGDYVTRGYLVYDWRQSQPRISESSSIKQTGRFTGFFDRLIISSDQKGDFALSLMVGDEIATTLTPMTFRKAGFNGVVGSFSTGRLRATGIFSRLSDPVLSGTSKFDQMTNLGAGRVEADIGDRLTMGFTLINSHNSQGSRDSFDGNPLKGFLTREQTARRPNLIVVQLSDDSPEDNEGGAVLIAHDVEFRLKIPREVISDEGAVTVMKDTLITGSSIGFRPLIEGGLLRQGLRTADGYGKIVMRYYLGPSPELADEDQLRTLASRLERPLLLDQFQAEEVVAGIEEVRFRMVLANDYRIEMSSDHQTNLDGVPQFRLVTRADGNTRDLVNQREVVFSYGLPTALQTYGVTAELKDFHGIDFYGELNVNTQYLKYPTPDRQTRRAFSGIAGESRGLGFMVNASWRKGPFSLFGEGFGMDDSYATSVLPLDRSGLPDFSPENTRQLYDFVEDNDDNDRHPDQLRHLQGSLVPQRATQIRNVVERGVADPEVFPGYDENGDFISDFNQNNNPERPNFFPDYDEPFVRYRSDRPQFLFGIDLNNNGWPERFENDDEPDLPYKKDHWGYNLFGTAGIAPGAKVRLGRLRQDLRESGGRNHTDYGMITFERDDPRLGRVRFYDMLKKAEDTIADDLVQWIVPEASSGQPASSPGRLQSVPDLLAAADTWINTAYADWGLDSPRGWSTLHRVKWETWRQRDSGTAATVDSSGDTLEVFDPLGAEGRNGRARSGFFGVINKAEYLFFLRQIAIAPRFKSELLRATPFSRDLEKRRSWDGIFSLQFEVPFLSSSRIRLGWEQRLFYDTRAGEEEAAGGERTGDFHGTALAAQLTNVRDYLGYALTTQAGIRIDRRSFELSGGGDESGTSGLLFLTMFAALR